MLLYSLKYVKYFSFEEFYASQLLLNDNNVVKVSSLSLLTLFLLLLLLNM